MARPKKCRKVCCMPPNNAFGPIDGNPDMDSVILMTVEEYETIRLIDQQGLTQEECAEYMNVARTTVQKLYNDARKKLADSLVEGKALRINGGDYQLCNGRYPHPGCRKRRRFCQTDSDISNTCCMENDSERTDKT